MTATRSDLLTLAEIQTLLKCSRSAVYQWMAGDGVDTRFPAPVKLGRANRWIQSEVEEWFALQPRALIGG